MGTSTAQNSWVLRDTFSIWHPFTQVLVDSVPIVMSKGRGAFLFSNDGTAYFDAISSWWTNLHGHAHPYIAEAIAAQAGELEHVIFAGYSHPQAILLAERLLSQAPKGYCRVFYTDNGSTSVEAAIKMAFQIQGPGRFLLSFENGYHGDTFGAMAAAGKTHFNRPFWPYMFEIVSIPAPVSGREVESWKLFERALDEGKIGAFIFEPTLQGAGGMVPHCAFTLNRMIQACHEKNVITIADEVMTGFGRTGPLFASLSFTESPDILCLSKGITGGFLPLGATLVKPFVFDSFLSMDRSRAFLHGHSYTGNPLACAAANASLDLLLDPKCSENRARIESAHRSFQSRWKEHPKLARCDVIGTILVVEYRSISSSYYDPIRDDLIRFFLDRNILVRPLGNVLYLLPPYCAQEEDLHKFYNSLIETLEKK